MRSILLRKLGDRLGRFLPTLVFLVMLPAIATAGYIGDDDPIADKNYDQQNPQTIYLTDKNVWFVVWQDRRCLTASASCPASSGDDIYGQFINGNDGSFCGEEFAVTNAQGNQTVPYAAYRDKDLLEVPTGSDKIIVVWQDTRGDASSGYVRFREITSIPDESACAGYTPPAPASGTPIGFNGTDHYELQTTFPSASKQIGTGNDSATTFIADLTPLACPTCPIAEFSVSVTDGGSQILGDNGFGSLLGDGSGSIFYSSGNIIVSFTTPPALGAAITVDYNYVLRQKLTPPINDTLQSRKQPKIHYDLIGDIFWVVWSESRSILNFSSEVCFGLANFDWQYGDASSFPGYVELRGSDLVELDSETSGITGADIIRNDTVRTNRRITESFGAFVETYEYEFFTNVNNLAVASDSTSPKAFIIWEGERRKGVMTCTCTDDNESKVCDAGDTITSTFATSDYDDGLVHVYGLFDNDVHNEVIYSKWLDNLNTSAGNYPSIAFDPVSQMFLAAWEDGRDGANTPKIYGQLIYSGSGLYKQNFIISYEDFDDEPGQDSAVADSRQTKPFVSYDPVNQRFFIVWQDGRIGGLENLDIFGQKVDAEGTLRGENYAIFTKPFNQWAPSIAYNDITDEYLSVWKDARNAESSPGVPNNTCSPTGGSGTGNKPCGSDVYSQRFTLGQPSITLLSMDDTRLAPVILMDFQNPPDSGSVTVGLFANQSLKIRSTGDVTLKIDCIDRTCGGLYPDMSPFDFDGFDSSLQLCNDGQTLDLVPGAEIPLTVRFEPEFGGSYNRCFIIESDGGNPRVNVSGIGIEPDIEITPTSHDFGSIYIGSTGEKAFVVRNKGTADLIISSLNSPATPFTIQDGGCVGQMIMPGSTCTITARFIPTATGAVNSTFGINSNDPDTPVLNVALSGTGLGAQDITVTPLSVAFGNVQVGETDQKTIQVRNDGTASLTINSIGNAAAPFSSNHNCPITPSTLNVGGSCTITLQFSPTTGGSTAATVIIQSNDPDEGTVNVNISGSGVVTSEIPVDSQIVLTPSTLDFLTVPVGQTATRTLTVSNSAGANLAITAVSNPSSPFVIELNNCTGKSLAPAGSCTITVSFNPAYEAIYFPYYITISSSDPDNPNIKATLKGSAGGALSSVTTGVFRPSTGELFMKNMNSTGFADLVFNYGLPGDQPVVGDWNGDGITTLGIYRAGYFYLRNSNTAGFAEIVFAFGAAGDLPIAGDWDGDGIDTIGVYRNGTFMLRNSNSSGAPDYTFALGNPGDVPIAGDWTGKGYDTVGVFRPSDGALYLKNTNTTGFADIVLNYGLPGDKPVTGDWDGDGTDTIGVYRNGTFMLRNSNTLGFADIVFDLGIPGDAPIAGDWDGLP